VRVLALTDHDTIHGIEEALKAARACGISLIPGVEIDVDSRSVEGAPPGETHILGLGLKNPSAALLQEMARLEQARQERGRHIIERMRERGWPASYEELAALAGTGIIGRPHVAAYLVKLKKARTIQCAFDLYLARGKDLHIPKESAPLALALAVIKESGGMAVLAHPASLYVSWSRLPLILAGLAEAGLDGIEAWHPMSTRHVCERMEKLGRSLGLCISAGSDFHGEKRHDRCLGRSAGGQRIPLSILEEIPALHAYLPKVPHALG
jgi:predicted metal-dependent phosphoesterase TrpH